MPSSKRTFWNANVPKPPTLPKGELIKIDFGEHKEEIKRIWEGKPPAKIVQQWKEQGVRSNQEQYYISGSMNSRMYKIQRLVGYGSNIVGYCSKCRTLNTHILKQKIQGAVIITRFCSEHVPDKI